MRYLKNTREYLRLSGACAALLTLAACGGGGGPSVTEDPTPGPANLNVETPRTVTGLRGGAVALLDIWAPNGIANYTGLASVPSTGSATYEGFIFGELSEEAVVDSLAGRLTLEATFDANDITFGGSATDFVDQQDAPIDGTLQVSGGTFNREGNPASDATLRGVAVAGTLEDGDGTQMVVGVQLEGDFLGTTANAIGGEAIGRVTIGSTTQDFDGGFVVTE